MRKSCLIITLLFLITALCGCNERKYKLSNTIANIQCIDIIYASPYKVSSITELLHSESVATVPIEEVSSFVAKLTDLPCQTYFMDPRESLLGYIIRIAYEDGSYELICAVSGLYCKNGNFEWKHLQFDENAYNAFIRQGTVLCLEKDM